MQRRRLDCFVATAPRNDARARKIRKRNAGRRSISWAVPAGTAARHGQVGLRRPVRFGRARLPAFHHGTCGEERTPPLSSSHALPGTVPNQERALPAPCRHSVQRGYPRRPVLVPAGRICPEPPGSAADEAVPAGTVPTPHRRGHRPCVLTGGHPICNYNRDICHITFLLL